MFHATSREILRTNDRDCVETLETDECVPILKDDIHYY